MNLILLGMFAFFFGMVVLWVVNNIGKYRNPEGGVETSATGSQNLAMDIVGALKDSKTHSVTMEGPRFWFDDVALEDFGLDLASAFPPFVEIDDIQLLSSCSTTKGVLTLIGPEQMEGSTLLVAQKYYYIAAKAGSGWACVKICAQKECSFE